MEKIYDEIRTEARKYNIDKIVLFGSRARGDNKPKSDIDIAVYGELSNYEQVLLSSYIKEELPTLLEFDVVFVDKDTSPDLVENIKRDGVLLYEKT